MLFFILVLFILDLCLQENLFYWTFLKFWATFLQYSFFLFFIISYSNFTLEDNFFLLNLSKLNEFSIWLSFFLFFKYFNFILNTNSSLRYFLINSFSMFFTFLISIFLQIRINLNITSPNQIIDCTNSWFVHMLFSFITKTWYILTMIIGNEH